MSLILVGDLRIQDVNVRLAYTRCVDRRNRRARHCRLYSYLLMALLLGAVSGLLGCGENLTKGNADTRDRVERNLLPPILDESGVVLRNLLNMFPLLSEICATPLGRLGDFDSDLPELQRAQQQEGDRFRIDESNGVWRASWRDVVFGHADGQTAAPGVDLTVTLRFRSQTLTTLQAVPFALAPERASLLTARNPPEPPACTPERPEGFLLFQDAASGVWTLSWCAQEAAKTFAGSISAQAITRVLRRLSDDAAHEVSSLFINEATTEVTFRERAEPGELNGFRFFVRPGELVRLELSLGPEGDPQTITGSQILLGDDQPLPANLAPADFRLAASWPIDPTGAPEFTPSEEPEVFIWQDTANNQCLAGEDQWRIRFSTPGSSLFEGFARTTNENDGEETRLSATAVGGCPAPSIEDNTTVASYRCTVQDATPSGYDICATNSQRMAFSPEVGKVRDPSLVSIGRDPISSRPFRPPAPDPFTILFELEIKEKQSPRELTLTNGVITLHGDFDDKDFLDTPLRPDQVSLDPLCREPVNPAERHVRLQGQGRYATQRFQGSVYEVDNVELTDAGTMLGLQRLPDLGRMILRTRQDNENVEITAPMENIREPQAGQIETLIDVDLRVDAIQFLFEDRAVNLTLE